MEESTIIAITTSVVGLLATAGSGIGGYILGKKQEITRLRLSRAFPLAEEIAAAIFELHDLEGHLLEWYRLNFGHLDSVPTAVRYIEESPTYRSGSTLASAIPDKRVALREKLRTARVHLNAEDLDRIEEYLTLGEFTSESDGMGGILFDNRLTRLFENLLDPAREHDRSELFLVIKHRLNRMHEI